MQQIPYHRIDFVAETVFHCSTLVSLRKRGDFTPGKMMPVIQRNGCGLTCFADRLVFNDWMLLYAEIEHASLFKPTAWWQGGLFLQITTATHALQFFTRSQRLWMTELPFPLEKREGRLEFEPTSFWQRLRNAM